MTLFRLALRSHFAGFAGATVIAVITSLANTVGYGAIAGTDLAARAVFAQQMELVGRQLSYLLPLPEELDTLSGYLQWRHFGFLPVVYAFWALLAGTGAAREDEERGLVEHWLSTGLARFRYLFTRVAAFAVAAVASATIMGASAYVGSIAANETLPLAALAVQCLNVAALALCCFGIALAVSQLVTTARGAAGAGGVLLFATYLINSAARNGGLEQLRPLSPFWAYDLSRPLVGAGRVEWTAIAALAGVGLILAGVAAFAFESRDLGAALLRRLPPTGRPVTRPSRDPFLKMPVLAIVDQQWTWIAGWALGIAVMAAFLMSLVRLMVDSMLQIPQLRFYFEQLGASGYEASVGLMWGSTALLLLTVYAIAQVGSWVADDAEGRLETYLAQPISRARVVLERIGALLVATAVIVAAGSAAVAIMASRERIELDATRFTLASALMPAVPLAFGAVGAVLAGARPRLAVPALTAVAIASYFTQQLAPLFDWPEWVESTSLYSLYGTPMSTGVEWGGMAALIVIGLAATALAVVTMRRRDVGR
jgi:ABC-2 type transport system permease protein